jgi:molecular chaperone GrpE
VRTKKQMSDPRKKEPEEIVVEFDRSARGVPRSADSGGEADSQQADAAGERNTSVSEQVTRLEAEKKELTETMVRRQADFDNYRKRIERERQEEHRRGVGRLIEELLPVLDGFERGLKAHDDPAYEEYRKGLELIYRQLWDSLSRHGLERIAAAGKQFDPHFHQAIERVETRDYPDGAIVEVLQDGFLFHGRVLRPSIVRVAANSDEAGGDRPSASGAAHHRAS